MLPSLTGGVQARASRCQCLRLLATNRWQKRKMNRQSNKSLWLWQNNRDQCHHRWILLIRRGAILTKATTAEKISSSSHMALLVTAIAAFATAAGDIPCFCLKDDADDHIVDERKPLALFPSMFKDVIAGLCASSTKCSPYQYHHHQHETEKDDPDDHQEQQAKQKGRTVAIKRLFSDDEDRSKATTRTKLHNQVVLISNILSSDECQTLRSEADRLIHKGYSRDYHLSQDDDFDDDNEEDLSLRRISIEDMSQQAKNISKRMLQERILRLLNDDLLISLGLDRWKKSSSMKELSWDFATDEPTVNVYTKGGQFEKHRDGYSLTVIVILNENPNLDFNGGGTVFYDTGKSSQTRNKQDGNDDHGDASVTIHPKECGTAICFDGDMMHAGHPVISGKRYVYVASFGVSIDDDSQRADRDLV